MIVLGIESTCDETSFALVASGKQIISHVISSQIDLHAQFGGVVPELACRRHIEIAIPILKETLQKAQMTLDAIDLIAVAKGPGLIGPLMIGMNLAKGLAFALNKPFIGVNHIEAHLYAAIMDSIETTPFPALGVVISGGHTTLLEIQSLGKYHLLGKTIDDSIGEAFDKVATLIGLPYPGGPPIEQLAKTGNPDRYPFKAGNVKSNPLDFSFSGLKTSVLYAVKGQSSNKKDPLIIQEEDKKDVAASFQKAAFKDLILKTKRAIKEINARSIIFGGGVSNSQTLRAQFADLHLPIPLYWPTPSLSLDNGAMIAALGYHTFREKGKGDPWDLEPMTRIPL